MTFPYAYITYTDTFNNTGDSIIVIKSHRQNSLQTNLKEITFVPERTNKDDYNINIRVTDNACNQSESELGQDNFPLKIIETFEKKNTDYKNLFILEGNGWDYKFSTTRIGLTTEQYHRLMCDLIESIATVINPDDATKAFLIKQFKGFGYDGTTSNVTATTTQALTQGPGFFGGADTSEDPEIDLANANTLNLT